MSSDTEAECSSWSYTVNLEMIAVEFVDGNPLDPEQDVPFTVVWETHDDLLWLCPGGV